MTTYRSVVAGLFAAAVLVSTGVSAQAGSGLLDPNVAAEKDLLSLPHMTPAIVKGVLDRRPFMSITELNAFLLEQKLTPQQTADIYQKAFIHVNLNTGTRDEIGKYVSPKEVARFWRYFVI